MNRRTSCSMPVLALTVLLVASGCGGSQGDTGPSVFEEATTTSASLAGDGGPIDVTLARIPEAALPDTTLPMYLGRFFEARDYGASARPAVVISHDVWQSLGGEPSIIGSELDVAGTTRVLLGVAPPGWSEPAGAGAWIPE